MTIRDDALDALMHELGAPDKRLAWSDILDIIAAAGLLRPDTTVDDREALADIIDGTRWRDISARIADDILAAGFSRPRGPVTETPAVTRGQVEAVVERVLLVDVAIRYGCLATIADATDTDRAMAERLVSEIVEGLGIEVRAGEDR